MSELKAVRILLFSIVSTVLWFSSSTVAQELPKTPRTEVVTLTPSPGFHNETSVAIDPNNPNRLVAAWQIPASAAYSDDAGIHWTTAKNTAPQDFRMSGDPSVTFDNKGHAYLCYIAFDKLGTSQYWGHNATRNGIFVRRSPDGGKTWEEHDIPVISHPTEPHIPFEDKPFIVADTSNGPYSGTLYVGWTQFTETRSLIFLSRSTDEGKSWSEPVRISTEEGLPRDDNGAVEGFTGAVDREGTLFVAWADRTGLSFTSSSDGGRTFQASRTVVPTAPLFFTVANVDRANGFPVLNVDDRPGVGERLYLTWSDYRNGDVDVLTSVSYDHGQMWSEPVRVNTDPIHDGKDQFFAWAAVAPDTGALNVIFYDRRGDKENRGMTVTLARSTDGAKTFQNYAWTTKSFNAEGDFLGDYLAIAAHGNRVYGVWTERVPTSKKQKKQKEKVRKQKGEEPAADISARRTIVRAGVADFSGK